MKARVFFLNPIAKYRCEINESGIGLTGNEVKVIETEPLLAELQAVREKVFKLSYFGHLESTAMADYASSILDSLDEVIKTLEEK